MKKILMLMLGFTMTILGFGIIYLDVVTEITSESISFFRGLVAFILGVVIILNNWSKDNKDITRTKW